MAQLKDIFKVTQSQYNTLMDGGTVGSHTYDSNAIYLVEGSNTISLATDSTLGGIKIGYTSTENNRALLLDNEKAYIALPSRLYAGRTDSTSPDSATNSGFYYSANFPASVGFGSNQGTMFVSSYSSDWVAQIAIGCYTNKMIFRKKGNGWSDWETVATESWVTEQLSDVDVDLSNYVDKTTTQTITGSKTFKDTPITLQTTKSAGTAVNVINVTTSTRSGAAMKIIPYNANGTGIILGDGGVFIAGSGESASSLWDALKSSINGGSENTYITSDGSIYLVSNCDSIANRKQVEVTGNGVVVAPGGFNIASKATWQYNSSTDCVELVW